MEINTNPRTEIVNNTHFDILINHRQTSISSLELDQLQYFLLTDLNQASPEKPLQSWKRFQGNERTFVNNRINPKYFAKIKWIDRQHNLLEKAIKIDRLNSDHIKRATKKEIFANDSVMNEMALSPRIKSVVESDAAQELFRKCNIETVSFVEPLIGIIIHKTGKKILIYKYIEGVTADKHFREQKIFEHPLEAVKNLRALFHQHNIAPNDLSLNQFIVSGNNRHHQLHLIDTEMYHKII